MRVRTYLIVIISVVALGACVLVGGLALSFQDLESQQEQQAESAKALADLKYIKEDLGRLTTIGDLVFGASKGLNSYLIRPVLSQIQQIERRLDELKVKVQLEEQQARVFKQRLDLLSNLFNQLLKGDDKSDGYDMYDQLSFDIIQAFRALYETANSIAQRDLKNLDEQRAQLEFIAWFASLCYLLLIVLLTWWSNRTISLPVARLSDSATKALSDGAAFSLTSSGPTEFKSLGAVLFRLINQLEEEVQKKTADLELENQERRAVEAQLRVLNKRQEALVEASVRFVPRPFLEFLGRSDLTLVERGDSTRQRLGILFSDLRGFTSLAERRAPQEIFDLLNRYLDAVVPAIHKHYGFVDKYIGDAIMALFPHQAERAVDAAIEMFHRLYSFVEQDQVPLKMGVGIHWGEVVLGTLGSKERWESTVIGDTVNLAARLEGMTKTYECPLIISEPLVRSLPTNHKFSLRCLDLVRVKGRSEPVRIYEVIDAHPALIQRDRIKTLDITEEAFECYVKGDIEQARALFLKAREVNDSDPLPQIFIGRCDHILQGELPVEWSGVFNHQSK